ncbi:MAG: twin-arginine translocase TatA/TatE family subunit [Flavobacteriaceae bacterium]|uniref:Sec-independent protein translocase subunit TatA/TatB n=1 Tax=Mesoflavibacter sp. CH_XMU1404-2 TaxID=3107766 RepID=UPI00176BAC17|nr:twin-arginine translocase TatA/TatE family subunit [Flavobacteriaceae bacterium]HIC30850.1 twin-arginine translocase TatA/TatE family subunit [Flavobacteriaceae bacterium]|tara:strand:- start:102 stop:389 length:288 start_codon:yes stop_codon:yes gene_type:complete
MILASHILFISTPEVFFILLVVVMLFGAKNIPDIAKGLGKGMRTLKDATNDIKHEITKSAENNGIDTSITKDVNDELNKVKDDLEQFTGSIKRNK